MKLIKHEVKRQALVFCRRKGRRLLVEKGDVVYLLPLKKGQTRGNHLQPVDDAPKGPSAPGGLNLVPAPVVSESEVLGKAAAKAKAAADEAVAKAKAASEEAEKPGASAEAKAAVKPAKTAATKANNKAAALAEAVAEAEAEAEASELVDNDDDA